MIGNLWRMSLQSCILIPVVLLIRRIFRKFPRSYTYGLWLLVLLRLLCPVFIESSFSLQPDMEVFRKISGENESVVAAGQLGYQQESAEEKEAMTVSKSVFSETTALNSTDQEKITKTKQKRALRPDLLKAILEILYITGVSIVAVYYLIQLVLMKARVKTAVHEKGNIWICDEVSSPFVMGILNPKIYLPYDIEEKDKNFILRHESAHLKRGDLLVRSLWAMASCLHFWNPLVWYAFFKMNQDMEICCDETFLLSAPLSERKAYADTLVRFAIKQSGMSVTLSFGESNTVKRVKNILGNKKRSAAAAGTAVFMAVVCAMVFLTVPVIEVRANAEMEKLSRILIEDQTFDVNLNPLGDVTFSSYSVGIDADPHAEVMFTLTDENGNEYILESVHNGNVREDEKQFQEVEAVSFPDYNGDGYEDVITITSYQFLTSEFTEAGVYTGTADGTFRYEEYLSEEINNAMEKKTIADIVEFAQSERGYQLMEGHFIYGTWKIEDVAGTTKVYAMSPEEIENTVGVELEYGRYWYGEIEGESYGLENYDRKTVDADDFKEEWGIPLSNLNVDADLVISIDAKELKAGLNPVGKYIYMIDSDTALIYHEGVFFRAIRVKE